MRSLATTTLILLGLSLSVILPTLVQATPAPSLPNRQRPLLGESHIRDGDGDGDDDGKGHPVPGKNPLRFCKGHETEEFLVVEHVNLDPNPPLPYEKPLSPFPVSDSSIMWDGHKENVEKINQQDGKKKGD